MDFKQFLARMRLSGGSAAPLGAVVFPVFLAAFFCLYNLHFGRFGSFDTEFQLFDLGGFFLAGLPGDGITFNMPLFEILVAIASQFGINSSLLFIILHMAIYALVFSAGCLLRGYWAGIISLAIAGSFGVGRGMIYEQAFYSFLLLLVLQFLLLKRQDNTLKNNILCGLAVGASLLVRTPLFLFPPVVVFCDWLCSSDRLRVFLLRSLVFLAASYVLLVPWAALNHSVSGKSAFFDDARARDNVVTAAMGSIFVMEGNSLKAAGLAEGDSAFSFYVREVGKKPFFHAVTVLRRLWHIFLFYPVLFTLFLAAVFFSREKGKTLVFCLPVYFILIHSPLSIEVRYFYPLLYLLPPLIAGTFLPERFSMSPELRVFTGRAIKAAAWASFTAVLVCEVFITAYPARAAHNPLAEDSFTRASERFPRDRVFYEMKCRELWRAGDDAAFYTCLEGQSQKFGDKVKAYFLSVKSSAVPSLVQLPPGGENQDFILGCLIVRMLREFELGEKKAAMASFREAHGVFERNYNRLHGNQKSGVKKLDDREDAEPYRNDRDIAGRISRDSDRFWEMAYGIIIMWPPEGMVKILSGIKENIGLEGRMEMLDGLLAGTGGEAGEGSRGARERIASASAGMRGTLPRLSPGGPGLPGYRSETGKRSESMRRE